MGECASYPRGCQCYDPRMRGNSWRRDLHVAKALGDSRISCRNEVRGSSREYITYQMVQLGSRYGRRYASSTVEGTYDKQYLEKKFTCTPGKIRAKFTNDVDETVCDCKVHRHVQWSDGLSSVVNNTYWHIVWQCARNRVTDLRTCLSSYLPSQPQPQACFFSLYVILSIYTVQIISALIVGSWFGVATKIQYILGLHALLDIHKYTALEDVIYKY